MLRVCPARGLRAAGYQRHRHRARLCSPVVRANTTCRDIWASKAARGAGGQPGQRQRSFPPANSVPRCTPCWPAVPVPDPDREALRLAEVFRQSPLGRRAARAARIAREFDFLMAMEDLVIRGQVDLWFEEGGELVVVDYKTDDVTAAEAHHRARDYELQLRLYALRRGTRGGPRPGPRLAPLPAPQHPGGSGPDAIANRKSRADRPGLSGSAIEAGLSAESKASTASAAPSSAISAPPAHRLLALPGPRALACAQPVSPYLPVDIFLFLDPLL